MRVSEAVGEEGRDSDSPPLDGPPPGAAESFVVLGVDQGSAPIAAREELVRGPVLGRLLDVATRTMGLRQTLTLVTCNRVECWAVASAPVGRDLPARLGGALQVPGARLRVDAGPEAFIHAVRVASGLDSGVWAEAEIAGQVRDGARASGLDGPGSPLGEIVQGVLGAAAAVRRAAGPTSGQRGAPEAAVDSIRMRAPGMPLRTLVIGSGAMGRRAAKRAAALGPVTIASHDLARAQDAARTVGAEAVPLASALSSASSFGGIVVALRADRPVVLEHHLVGRSASSPLTVVDLSFPRAVERPARLAAGVRLLDLDDLAAEQPSPDASSSAAAEAAARAWAMKLWERHASRPAEPLIAAVRRGAEAIRRDEVESARRRLRGDPVADAAVLEKLAERLVNRVLHEPTQALRAATLRATLSPTAQRPGPGGPEREDGP